ncbi:MAG: ABC transporter permease subunit [Myxococcota bacterium]
MRSVLLVAWFDLRESLRSRKALALMFIYLMGAMAATGIFVTVLAEVEAVMADTLMVARTARPGAMTQALRESDRMQGNLGGLLGEPGLAAELVRIPPLGLFYGWLAMSFGPLLVTFTSAEAIAGDLASGTVRFSLFRISRLEWAAGKLLGQSALLAVGMMLGAAGVWAIGWYSLMSFEPLLNAAWLVRFAGRGWIYGFAFLGMTLGVSQLTRSINGARALALAGLLGLSIGGVVLMTPQAVAFAPILADTVRQLCPNAHRLNLWRPLFTERAPALVMLLALGGTYFSLGYQWMSRRDA